MTRVALDHPREDAKTLVKASLERVGSIDAYTDDGQRIVAKQEATVTGGNGARLIVDVPEMQDDDRTAIEVSAEKEVSIDVATDPEEIKSEFLAVVNDLRDRDLEAVLDEMSREMAPHESKEVASSREFSDPGSALGKRFVVTFVAVLVFTIFFGLMMTAAMMP